MNARKTFGLRPALTVQSQCGAADAAAWNTVREWTGPRATVTADIRKVVARLASN